jgi:hypothetical protein
LETDRGIKEDVFQAALFGGLAAFAEATVAEETAAP